MIIIVIIIMFMSLSLLLFVVRPPGHTGKAQKGHLAFEATYESANLGRVDFVSDTEYDVYIRPDTCNPRHRSDVRQGGRHSCFPGNISDIMVNFLLHFTGLVEVRYFRTKNKICVQNL